MSLEFNRSRIDRLSREQVLAALMAAAEHFQFGEFGKREFSDGHFGCSAGVVQRQFGSWNAGIEALREELAKAGRTLAARSRAFIPDAELYEEMERIWHLAGQRPSRYEWERHAPRYSYGTYKRRFGGWQQACLAFIEQRMGTHIEARSENPSTTTRLPRTSTKPPTVREEIPLRLRLRVLDRDGFRCCLCGRSPAIEAGVVLHIDHVLPVSRGGLATLENLRTLCAECNLGRGNVTELGA